MRRIVIGYDGSERGEDALALGRAFARLADEPHVIVATVYPALIPRTAHGEPSAREQRLRDDAERLLERARERWPELPASAFRAVRGSSPAAGLHRLVREEELDLIVVGSSHRHGLGRIWHGSATEQTLHGSPRPVAVAPPGYAADQGAEARIERIGLAYDGSPESDHALGRVAELADATAAVRVVDILEPIAVPVVNAYGEIAFGEELRRVIDADLARARETLAARGVATVEAVRLEGDAVARLVEESERLDLLALGSRNHGPALRLLLGSVSARVVREARCPVLVFPRSAAAEIEPADARATAGAADAR